MRHPTTATWYRAGLLLLTAATGTVDAVSYLALDRVFTGNMTGNVLFIGFALVGVAEIPLLNNVVALGGFALGSVVGGRVVGRGHTPRLPRSGAWVLACGAALAVALGVAWRVAGDPEPVALLVVTALLAALMGAQVAAVKPIGNADITTVVVTSTLANLTRESRLAGGRQPRGAATDRLLAVVAMGAGAALGAAVIRAADGPAALLSASGLLVLGAAALARGRLVQRAAERAVQDDGDSGGGR
ncbi:YoaK family protein [Cellulomonas sp. ATA003]|uniref:YoaK family protein n=1 Tax=Cellulomonas sp. ATA003 TaxID=3073064 RepID=UPI002873C0DB|nr:YoaK family protein [Cellulomonas sp. ATA003]WNB85141.1 YoaK family protein [Cellulomonas sp. ATA003]